MSKGDAYEALALAAGWRPHPRNTRENREVALRYPELSLRVWAELDGVHLYALIWYPVDGNQRRHVEIAKAVWQPSEVTEYSVVDWGRRALGRWLVDHPLDPGDPEVEDVP
jgi:hypothetical protein